jgi:hypothetical protein
VWFQIGVALERSRWSRLSQSIRGTAEHRTQGRACFWPGAAYPCGRAPLCDSPSVRYTALSVRYLPMHGNRARGSIRGVLIWFVVRYAATTPFVIIGGFVARSLNALVDEN